MSTIIEVATALAETKKKCDLANARVINLATMLQIAERERAEADSVYREARAVLIAEAEKS